jgi:hypothetical protein
MDGNAHSNRSAIILADQHQTFTQPLGQGSLELGQCRQAQEEPPLRERECKRYATHSRQADSCVLDRNALPQIAAECQIGTNTSDDAYCGDWSPSHQDRKLPLVVAGWVSDS